MKKVVLAYSGGLDTSVAVAWLREQFDVEVVTLTVDVGGGSLREGVAGRAMSAGASRAYVVDARDRFVRQFVWPSLQANAKYQGVYPLATALARPLIAQLLVEVANRERADAVAHGCTGKGNDQVRFDVAVHALDPEAGGRRADARRHGPLARRGDQLRPGARHRGPGDQEVAPYSVDVNLWGRSIETGILEDPWATPPPTSTSGRSRPRMQSLRAVLAHAGQQNADPRGASGLGHGSEQLVGGGPMHGGRRRVQLESAGGAIVEMTLARRDVDPPGTG